MIDELIEKWEDVLAHSDDFTEKSLTEEFLSDLKELRRFND